MTLNDKIKDSVQKTTGLKCYVGEPSRLVIGKFAFFYPLAVQTRYSEVAIFFVERPFLEEKTAAQITEECNQLSIKWLNGLYAYSGLKFQEVFSKNPVTDGAGGFGVGMRVVLVDEQMNRGGKQIELVELTLSCDPLNSATLSGATKYAKGRQASAGANAMHGFTFSKWTDGVEDVSTDNPYQFTINNDTSLVAVMTRNNYSLALTGDTGVDTTTGAGTYPYEQQVSVGATTKYGFSFANWTADGQVVSSSNPYSFQLMDNTSLVANTTRNNYTVSLTAENPTSVTNLTGAGTYPYEQNATVGATTAYGFTFSKWTDGTSDISTSNPYTFPVLGDTSLVAVTTRNNYTLSLSADTQGSISSFSGAGTYPYETSVTASATAAHGFTFSKWTDGTTDITSQNPYTFSLLADTSLVAVVTRNNYTVSLTGDTGISSTSGAGTYPYESSVTVSATPATGFTFAKWTDGTSDVSTQNPYQFTLDDDTSLVAVTTRNNYTLSLSGDAGISSTSGGGSYPYESNVTATATAAHGYTFANWTNGGTVVSSSNPYTFALMGDTTLVANSTRANYTVSLSEDTQGSITSFSGAGTYPYETSVTVSATPAYGFTFAKWTDGTSDISTQNPYTFALDDNTSLVAVVTRNTYSVSLSAGTGVTSVSGAGTYAYEANATATAVVDSHYDFTNWTSGQTVVSNQNPYSFQVTGAVTLQANATPKSYNVLGVSNDPTLGSVSGGGTYTYGDTVTLTATPTGSNTFVNWTVGGTVVSTSNPYVLTATEAVIVQGNFAVPVQSYTVTTAVNDATMGSAAGGGSYQSGATCVLTATPNTGYQFVEWQVNGSQVSTSDTYSFTVSADVTVTAVFEVAVARDYLKFTANDAGSTLKLEKTGSPVAISLETSTDGTTWTSYTIGDTITLSSQGDYVMFRGDNPNGISTDYSNRYSFSMTGRISASGKVTSLYDSTCQSTTLPSSNIFSWLFRRCSALYTAPELPATTLSDYCYYSMFTGCTSLTTPPALPATTLNEGCYKEMFYRCSALYTAPVLPATTTARHCYYEMFDSCTSLTTPPALPATTLGVQCYSMMFHGCTTLATPPALPATTLSDGCYSQMFQNCTSMATAPELPATTLTSSCYTYMFNGCRAIAEAPKLPASDISTVYYSYQYLFGGCSSLRRIEVCMSEWKMMFTTGWVRSVAATGDFYCPSALPDTYGNDNIPTGWTRHNCVTVTTAVNDSSYGSVTGGGFLEVGTTCVLKAVPATGYKLDHWEVGGTSVSTTTIYSFTVASDVTVTAVFTQATQTPNYLKFTSLQNGSTVAMSNASILNIQYSTDNGSTWNTWDKSALTVDEGNSVMFKGNVYSVGTSDGNRKFTTTGYFDLSGDLSSLLDETMQTIPTPPANCFNHVFSGCGIVNACDLVIPFTELSNSCCYEMFRNCTSLITAPMEISATTVGDYALYSMFRECTSLVNAPEIYAATTGGSSLFAMFRGDTSLVSAPSKLPATTGTNSCYESMFNGCTSLVKGPELMFRTGDYYTIATMFQNCTHLSGLTVHFTIWPPYSGLAFDGVQASGVFHCPQGLDNSNFTLVQQGIWAAIYDVVDE